MAVTVQEGQGGGDATLLHTTAKLATKNILKPASTRLHTAMKKLPSLAHHPRIQIDSIGDREPVAVIVEVYGH